MATFSQSITGVGAHNPFQPKNLTIDDAVCITAGAEQRAMRLGGVISVQGPDGMVGPYVFDAERCIPGVLRVIRKDGRLA